MSELITKAEASRRMKVSKTMVTKYIARGLPTEGGLIRWPDAQMWLSKNIAPSLSGNYLHRQRTQKIAEPAKWNLDDLPTKYFVMGFQRARYSLRRELPSLLAESKQSLEFRIEFFAMVDFLLDRWLNAGMDENLPPLDWSRFGGEVPADLQQFFDEAQAYFASSDPK